VLGLLGEENDADGMAGSPSVALDRERGSLAGSLDVHPWAAHVHKASWHQREVQRVVLRPLSDGC